MATQDFTTYTERDLLNLITVTASKVSWADLPADGDAWVYKDKGANYFSGNFELRMTYRTLNGTTSSAVCSALTLANLVNDWIGIDTLNGDELGLIVNGNSAYISEVNGGTQYFPSGDYPLILTLNTDYYLTIKRDEAVGTYGTLYLYVYSDAARTTLIATQTLTLHSLKDFRYIYAIQSIEAGAPTVTHSGCIENREIFLASILTT